MDSGGTDTKTMRRDAARSRAAILRALDTMYAEEGSVPGMHALAARAEVGVATLYRHFPTREDLLTALAVDRLVHLVEFADQAGATPDTAQAVRNFFESVAGAGCDPALVAHLSPDSADRASQELLTRFQRGLDHLLERAHADGVIRADAQREHVIALLHGLLATVAHLGDQPGGCDLAVDILARGLAAPQ
ncbi:TetR/AcrR family transcriptional regulator [Actinoplanes friuliensis]|uniref:TetR family transcriptional regulator n=1 Tax=Actinoplanes friuliensis DSM 7358 TaxID=1246995 RepID=U5VZ06_9ACTN|nr:TetR/AcrR family transcriptional regulator [Actinoplanes friuliensis]AGZ42084.1 TetR family transcriptional regulator [Actinoplanes friuliensis DSM 7358]